MATATRFQCFSEDLSKGKHNLDTDTIKAYLSNDPPVAATDAVKADVTEISAGNGYSAGGVDLQNATSRSGLVTSVTGVDFTVTASGGSIGPFRYVVSYNDTATGDPLIMYWDLGSSLTLLDGQILVGDLGTSIFTVG